MAKLNQIIAIEKGIKSRVYSEIGALHKALQKSNLFNGLVRSYQPKDADDPDAEKLPTERQRVQYNVPDVLRHIERMATEWFDVTARKDWSNCAAMADVVVDGVTLIAQAPVTFLLFIEKQLVDLRTIVNDLPVLDEAENWVSDENSGLFKTEPVATHRTKKVQRPLVLYPATPEHPAQTQIVTEDVIAGFWSSVKHSGAMPKPKKEDLINRVEKLLQAIKQAREAANAIDEVGTPKIGAAVFGYLLPS